MLADSACNAGPCCPLQNWKFFWKVVKLAQVVHSGSLARKSTMAGVCSCLTTESSILTLPFQSPCHAHTR